MMKIRIDRSKCVGAGLCVASDPAVFEQSEEDGLIVLLDAAPGADHEAAVREAELICPARVIELDG